MSGIEKPRLMAGVASFVPGMEIEGIEMRIASSALMKPLMAEMT